MAFHPMTKTVALSSAVGGLVGGAIAGWKGGLVGALAANGLTFLLGVGLVVINERGKRRRVND